VAIFLNFPTIGLGNNLFTLAAGLDFAKKFSLDLRVLPITSSGFKNTKLNSFSKDALYSVINYLNLEKVEISESYEIRNRLEKGGLETFYETCPYCYREPDVNIKNDIYMSGYFQNQEYLGTSLNKLLSTLAELTHHVKTKSEFSVQIRRGDFKNPVIRRSIGLLSPIYFSSWISKFPSSNIVRVYSDDSKSEIENFLGGLFPFNFVEPQTDILDTLRAIANSANLIISNSTFAWWAGALGEYLGITENVISPSQWNRNMECSKLLSRSSWIRAKPIWV